jgi:hypothetical protein
MCSVDLIGPGVGCAMGDCRFNELGCAVARVISRHAALTTLTPLKFNLPRAFNTLLGPETYDCTRVFDTMISTYATYSVSSPNLQFSITTPENEE